MSASNYVGRIGALAAAFGVGAAILTGPAIAWADPATSDASDSSAPDSSAGQQASGDNGSSTAGPRAHSKRGARPADSTPSQSASETGRGSADASAPDSTPVAVAGEDFTPRRGSDSAASAPQHRTDLVPSPAATTPGNSANDSPAVAAIAADSAEDTPVPASAPSASTASIAPAATLSVPAIVETVKPAVAQTHSVASDNLTPAVGLPSVIANVVDGISTVITSVVTQLANTFSGNSPFAPQLDSPANWLLLAAARRQPLAAATAAAQTTAAATPTLMVLNGYKVVAASREVVTSFYGPFVNFPGSPGIQGQHVFNLVDPATNRTVGSFKALTFTFNAIGTLRQLVVTDVLSGTAGTAAGDTPPVGSLISANGVPGFGTLYTSMPSPSGNVVSYKVVTPFGSIPQSTPYDAAKGLTDYVVVNKPLNLTGGFYIAPQIPSTEEFISVTGLAPLFTAVQGRQDYNLYDKSGAAVGSFEGLVTTTSDALGLFTKAILVTSTGESTNVGTGAGQVPPVGTVYNIINFTDQFYVLYSSMPSASGSVVSTKLVTPFGTSEIPIQFDASTPPEMKSLKVPGGYTFVPTSAQIPAGVNGLPPREVITQGYQQFDVIDALGKKIGSVDADVTRQWDWFGGTANAILITKVTSGSAGVLPWNVPPVGSVFNFRQPYGISLGFSDFYSSIPTPLGSIVVYQTVTPFGVIPNLLPNDLSKGLSDVDFVNPFV